MRISSAPIRQLRIQADQPCGRSRITAGTPLCATSMTGAKALLEGWYGERKVPGGGSTVVLEEALLGREASVMAVTDGRRAFALDPACDYKRAGESERIEREVLAPAFEGLRSDGIEYRGCLYAGIMMTADGPKVLEFNARFGDPETEVVLPRLESDLATLLLASANGELTPEHEPRFTSRACVGIVLVTEGYRGCPRCRLCRLPRVRQKIAAGEEVGMPGRYRRESDGGLGAVASLRTPSAPAAVRACVSVG